MKQYLALTKHFSLLATSLIASSVLMASPSRASTFAASQGTLVLTDFSHSPLGSVTNANADTIAFGQGGSVVSKADAIAFLGATPPLAFNFTYSEAVGKNQDYWGLAESEATVRGMFDVEANSWFSFKFAGDLTLETSVADPQTQNASASGEIFFALVDMTSNRLLDYFQVVGNLTTQHDNDVIDYQKSDNVTLNYQFAEIDRTFGRYEELGTAYFDGSAQRYFTNRTSFALIALNSNEASVAVPEPSTYIGLIFSCGVIGFVLRRNRQKTTLICLSPRK